MADRKNTDILFYNRLYRGNSDNDSSSYLVHADQVEDLQTQFTNLQQSYYKVADSSIGASSNHTITISNAAPEVGSTTGGEVGDIIIVVAD